MDYKNLPINLPYLAQVTGRWIYRRRATHVLFTLVALLTLYFLFGYNSHPQDELVRHSYAVSAPELSIDSTTYLPFRPATHPTRVSSPVAPLKPSGALPLSCLEDHIAYGKPCYNSESHLMDVVWTWVNGSDNLLNESMLRVGRRYPAGDPYLPSTQRQQHRQFRDHDELRHSLRSVLKNFRPYSGRFYVITADFAVPSVDQTSHLNSLWRLGQAPQWLKTKQQGRIDGRTELSVIHHADIFRPYVDTSFNSYAIESQFGHLENISENFIYLNDDFYFLKPLTPRSFHTSAYGIVLRMQNDLLVAPKQYGSHIKGEWRSLSATNGLLSNRFGSRYRPYVIHEAKSASLPLLQEISQMWSSQIANTALHPFRETKAGDGDISMMFMMVHFVVERWREALLWSWTVAKHGGLDDRWGTLQADAAWRELGGTAGSPELLVRTSRRDTLQPERVNATLKASGHVENDPTSYIFSSQDGYPYANIKDGAKNAWPAYGPETPEYNLPQCRINFRECFSDGENRPFTRASDTFKNIAFRNPLCGDCAILALVSASGRLGLEAFLPSSESRRPGAPSSDDRTPYLPLVDRWEDGDFSLKAVMSASKETSVRLWTLLLLERYRFVLADTPSHFAMLSGPSTVNIMAAQLARRPDVALLCINDDVITGHEEVVTMLKKWQSEQWSQPAEWET